jgi:AbrB family looped-hinge helix DNA binding protein
MVSATLTCKGQITIPKTVRESLRLHVGDRIEFVVHGRTEALLKPLTKSVDEIFGKLHRINQPVRTVDEMREDVARLVRSRNR